MFWKTLGAIHLSIGLFLAFCLAIALSAETTTEITSNYVFNPSDKNPFEVSHLQIFGAIAVVIFLTTLGWLGLKNYKGTMPKSIKILLALTIIAMAGYAGLVVFDLFFPIS